MSETTTTTDNPLYPSLSEATDNDNRDDLVAQLAEQQAADPDAEPQEPVETTETEVETKPEAVVETEDDLQARNARLARELREQRRRSRQLELETQTLRGQRTEEPNEAMEREISTRAAQLAQQQVINQRANEVAQSGWKEYGKQEFDDTIQTLNETFGSQMGVLIDTIVDIPDSHRLLQHLGDNPDMLDRLAALPPHKLGAALASEASKVAKPKPSRAPAPIRPIAPQSSPEQTMDIEKMSMEQLDKLWSKRDFERMYR